MKLFIQMGRKSFRRKQREEMEEIEEKPWEKFSDSFGINMPEENYWELGELIRENKFKLIVRKSNNVSLWKIDYQGQDFIAVYANSRKKILTFMPIEFQKAFTAFQKLPKLFKSKRLQSKKQ